MSAPSVKVEASKGIGFFGVLTIIFVTLKLAGIGQVAHWSWWWVLSPELIPLAILGTVLLLMAGLALAMAVFD